MVLEFQKDYKYVASDNRFVNRNKHSTLNIHSFGNWAIQYIVNSLKLQEVFMSLWINVLHYAEKRWTKYNFMQYSN
jgi:hypothetical protein